jgi:hypothetical protein
MDPLMTLGLQSFHAQPVHPKPVSNLESHKQKLQPSKSDLGENVSILSYQNVKKKVSCNLKFWV